MPIRNELHCTGEIYHVFSKSIAGYQIFNSDADYLRIIEVLAYYKLTNVITKYSNYLKNPILLSPQSNNNLVEIGAYCIMPTHIHLLLKQNIDNGISIFMNKCLNSYTKYFNIKHRRKGPLWESRFKSIRIENDDICEHVTRYIHLNPSTAGLVENPEDWEYSSYREYIKANTRKKLCNLREFIDPNPLLYKNFVESQIDYQQELARIKHTIIE